MAPAAFLCPRSIWFLSILLAAAFLAAAAAPLVLAQEQRRIMVNDDGSGPQILHMSMPDVAKLRQPQYLRTDMPDFDEELALNDTQKTVVRLLLDAYLEAFGTLVAERLPPPQTAERKAFGGGLVMPGGEGKDDMEAIGDIMRQAMEGEEGDSDFDVTVMPGAVAVMIEAGGEFDPADMPEGMAVQIELGGEGGGGEGGAGGAGGAGGGGAWADAGGANVMIALGGPEGVELPEEVLAKLEEKAREMAEQIRRHIEENPDAALRDPFDADAARQSMEDQRRFFEELAEKAKVFEQARSELGRQFVTDVQSQLTLEQLEQWPALERTLTRHKTLPSGRLDGERTDLIQVFEARDPDEVQREAVAEPLEHYELALHDALVQRNQFIADANDRIDEAIKENKIDRALTIADRATDLRIAVRQVNLDFAESMAAALDEEAAASFRDAVLRRSFPRIYRTTHAQRSFAAAKRLDGAGEDVLTAIGALEKAYLLERGPADDSIRQATLKHQPDEPRRGLEHLRDMMEGHGPGAGGGHVTLPELMGSEDPVQKAFGKRRELDEKYVKLLHELLTPQQIEALPKAPKRRVAGEPIIIRSAPRE